MVGSEDRMDAWDFFHSVKRDLERFRQYWVDNNMENTADFPWKMGEAEWWEQFMCFLQLEEDMK